MPKHHSWLRRANRAVCCVITAAFLAATAGPAWSWQTGHGHTDNSGFVDVPTGPGLGIEILEESLAQYAKK